MASKRGTRACGVRRHRHYDALKALISQAKYGRKGKINSNISLFFRCISLLNLLGKIDGSAADAACLIFAGLDKFKSPQFSDGNHKETHQFTHNPVRTPVVTLESANHRKFEGGSP